VTDLLDAVKAVDDYIDKIDQERDDWSPDQQIGEAQASTYGLEPTATWRDLQHQQIDPLFGAIYQHLEERWRGAVDVYHSTSEAVSVVGGQLSLDTSRMNDGPFTVANDDVEFEEAGRFLVSAACSFTSNADIDDHRVELLVEHYDGLSWEPIPGASGWAGWYQDTGGNVAIPRVPLDVSEGDKVRLWAEEQSTSTDIVTVAETARLTVTRGRP